MSHFADPDLGYDAAAAAMRFIENSDAVIYDMRYNNGGHLEMAQLLASQLFRGDKDQELFDYYYNDDGRRVARGQWVLAAIPAKRLIGKPVYILTASTSFSAAEWFAYSLKKLGRATLVGERTAGGAHPVDRKPVGTDFSCRCLSDQLRQQVALNKAGDALLKLRPQVEDMIAGGMPLADIAKTHKIAVSTQAGLDARGNDAAGKPVETLPQTQPADHRAIERPDDRISRPLDSLPAPSPLAKSVLFAVEGVEASAFTSRARRARSSR